MTALDAGLPQVTWAKGGDARVLRLAGEVIALSSSVSSPPGSRIEGTLATPAGATLRVKVHSSKRTDDGSFRIDGRVIDMTRELREALTAQLSPS